MPGRSNRPRYCVTSVSTSSTSIICLRKSKKWAKRELERRLEVLIMHLLKWQYQPNLRSRSWQLTIKEQRLRLLKLLKENPSLKAVLPDYISDAYPLATVRAEKETGLENFPNTCPFTVDQILDKTFPSKDSE